MQDTGPVYGFVLFSSKKLIFQRHDTKGARTPYKLGINARGQKVFLQKALMLCFWL